MRIIRCGDGRARDWSARGLQVDVTSDTDNCVVLASQLEDGIIVIKTARLPAIGCVAGFALRA